MVPTDGVEAYDRLARASQGGPFPVGRFTMLASGEDVSAFWDEPPRKPSLLAFFKSDCPACHLALRYIERLDRQVSGHAEVVGVSQDGAEPTAELLRSLKLEIGIRTDEDLEASRGFGLEAVPALFLIDSEGTVVDRSQGFDKADINRLAQKLGSLAGVAVTDPAAPGDGNPDFQPGCVSRHLEPPPEGADAAPVDLYGQQGVRASRVEVPSGADVEEFCYERGFADPLPVVPPTAARVDRMLAAAGLPADEVVARVPPNYGSASVEKIAANAVMAGCRPEYMRILLPLVRALCDERLNIHGVQGTTHFAAPLAIVNGPVRHELDFAFGSNVYSNTARANSTLGRALQLILRNLGGAAPGGIDMSTQGHPGRFGFVIAENEEASPWEPLSAEFGIEAGRDAVALYCAESPRGLSDHTARTPEALLRAFCPVLATVWSYRVCQRSEALVVICPEHAETLRRRGYSKRDARDYLFEHTGVPVSEYDGDGGDGTQLEGSYEECVIRGERCYRKFRRPEAIRLMVAGGDAGKHSTVLGSWATGPLGSRMVCLPVD